MKRYCLFALIAFVSTFAWAEAPNQELLTVLAGQKAVSFTNFTSVSSLAGVPVSYSGWSAGAGSCVLTSGLVGTSNAGPCLDNNPSPVSSIGLRIEGARTNLAFPSGNTGAGWTGSGATISYAPATVSPDGSSKYIQITNTGASGLGYQNGGGAALSPATSYSLSGFFLPGTAPYAIFQVTDFTANACGAVFNATTGAFVQFNNGGGCVGIGAKSQVYANGAFRVSFTFSSSAWAANVSVAAYAASAVSGATTNAQFGYFWGEDLELGAFASSLIPTSSASVTRAADSVSLTGSASSAASRGPTILESQSEQTGVISRACYAPGAFAFPSYIWARKLAIYQPSQSCASLTSAGLLNMNTPLR